MILMSEGLKAAAGSSLQRGISGLTRGPGQALAVGAGLTALVQSSSATTVATIGFVSAGMLTFPQALGVVMGANLGTTSTGWIVALLGLKLSIGAIALPLVGVGALVRLLASRRRAQLGLALAGFGLIFVGIDVLQGGMAGVASRLDPADFPSSGRAVGVLLLIVLGGVTTVVMQSSSAAVATTLTALHAGTLDVSQAAYVVIGQNLGTTVTAALAAVGASVPARRTATAHILFNLVTGVVAVALLLVLLPFLEGGARGLGRDDLALMIAAFHTAFNVLGVLLFLPAIGWFSNAVIRLVPEREILLTRRLDRSMSKIPSAALEAGRLTLAAIVAVVVEGLADRLSARRDEPGAAESDPSLDVAMTRLREFLGAVETTSESDEDFRSHVALLHATDHADRLIEVARETTDLWGAPEAGAAASRVERELRSIATSLAGEMEDGSGRLGRRLFDLSAEIAEQRRTQRAEVLERTAMRHMSPEAAAKRLQAMRWVDRVAYHAWRMVHHLDSRGEGSDQRR